MKLDDEVTVELGKLSLPTRERELKPEAGTEAVVPVVAPHAGA